MKRTLFLITCMLVALIMSTQEGLAVGDVQKNSSLSETRGEGVDPMDSLYGEWLLMGWNDGGTWVEVDKKKVRNHCLSIEFKDNGNLMAYSMVNDIYFGQLTLKGNELHFDGDGVWSTMVYGDEMENNFFEEHIICIKSYRLDGKRLRLYYTDKDYFVFTTISMNAQVEKLIYEKNWEGVEYSESVPFETAPDWMYEATAEGLAITNPSVTDQIWQVRVFSGGDNSFSLEGGHDYVVRLTMKVPSDGKLFMQLGALYSSWYDGCSVKASDDWQVIDIENQSFYSDISNAHVLLGLGEMVGTTILKKVQVYERTTQNTYHPFVEDGKVWKVGDVTSGNPVQLVDYYYFDGETIIDGKTCKQMMRQRYVSPDYAETHNLSQDNIYVGAWYEEDKKVYFSDANSEQLTLMYDFSVDANDTIEINNMSYVIGPKQTGDKEGFKGVYRNVRLWEDGVSYYSVPWLEGVGGTDRPTTSVYPGVVDPLWFLLVCYVDDEVIYFNGAEDGATPAGARKQRIDFTHTPKIKPKTREGSEENQSLYGEYNEQRLSINLDPINDAYTVSITDDSGKVVYEKPINAGNIVGLNIDISAYSEGCYIVTVDNSNESFTGEFNVITTGIEEVKSQKSEARGFIYNLQGQRLNSLQKGLNIVDGRKVLAR